MSACPRIYQLRTHPDAVGRALNAALDSISNSESIRNLAKIAFHPWPVLHHRVAADHFQIRDLGQVVPDLILNAHGAERLLWIGAQTFEGQNGNAPFCNSSNGRVIAKPNPKPNGNYRKEDAPGCEQGNAFQRNFPRTCFLTYFDLSRHNPRLQRLGHLEIQMIIEP